MRPVPIKTIDPGSGVGERGSELGSIAGPPFMAPLAELFRAAVVVTGKGGVETSAVKGGDIVAGFAIGCAGCACASAGCGFASGGCALGDPGCVLGGVRDDDGGAGDGENELRSDASLPSDVEAEVDWAVVVDCCARPTDQTPGDPAPSRTTSCIGPLLADESLRKILPERELSKGASLLLATLDL